MTAKPAPHSLRAEWGEAAKAQTKESGWLALRLHPMHTHARRRPSK